MPVELEPHPRERLLHTASRLFYADGIQAVGVERLIKEANVTRATMYRHYPSKDDLVVAYLAGKSAEIRRGVAALAAAGSPREVLVNTMKLVTDSVCEPDFRGCNFLNAAAEYPDPAHRVRVVIAEHRAWFYAELRARAAAAGHPDPDHAAHTLVVLRDGALQSGGLDDPIQVRETVQRAVLDLVGPIERG
jgi:AcrR family transcriptional regulator